MEQYNPSEIESKWQKKWEEDGIYTASKSLSGLKQSKPKFYALVEFPYPSGDGLHVGHVRSYVALDILARKKRMEGMDVLYPMGWDAFGLPAESYAVKTGIHPEITTKKNIDNFRKQMKSLGLSFDWSREINTTDPKYYKWTQWIFLQFFKKGLAYKAKMPINWCPKDKIGLANEEVVDGCCERCGTPVEKREKEQWMLAITKYADRLDKDLETVDYVQRIKTQQKNWIGKSEGAEITFGIKNSELGIKVFTTRPDTIFGATYLVLSPEHKLMEKLQENDELGIKNKEEIIKYIKQAKNKTDIERATEGREKTGVELDGIVAINPATKEEIPIWVADYVLAHYGTGAIMAVPADDKRDREFAEKYKLKIVEEYKKAEFEEFGKKITRYKLRDWVFSRQRYWGEPIPVIHCEKCGIVPVSENELPVILPKVEKYEYTDTGESPLASIDEWVNVKCSKCGGNAKRETDTMPNWAGSSWYFLRYCDSENEKEFASSEALKHWMPIDWYNGGMEHTVLHLLYSRFWNKFLFDEGFVPTSEPYKKRTSHGLILAEGGEKMSKSKGNVINPDEIVNKFGADTLRIYEMFMGPFDQAVSWSIDGIVGPRRFLEKVWKISAKVKEDDTKEEVESILHRLIKKVSEDIENMDFNTAVSALMICANEFDKLPSVSKNQFGVFLKILAPFAPHIAEELWSKLGFNASVHFEEWPKFKQEFVDVKSKLITVQIDGKVRANFEYNGEDNESALEEKALNLPNVEKWVRGREIKKIIHVKGKLISIVTNS